MARADSAGKTSETGKSAVWSVPDFLLTWGVNGYRIRIGGENRSSGKNKGRSSGTGVSPVIANSMHCHQSPGTGETPVPL